jgi:hypothetical protein
VAASGIILTLACFPSIVVSFFYLWHRQHYEFFPLVVIGSVLLFASSVRQRGVQRSGPLRWSPLLLIVPWVLLALAVLLGSQWLGAVAT